MKNWKSYLAAGLISTMTTMASVNLHADAQINPARSFDVVKNLVEGFGDKGMQKTLIVMDDDDTLTMMQCKEQKSPANCQYLGGPAWYSWQSDLIKNKSSSDLRVATKDGELLEIAALLLSLNEMTYTDHIIPDLLSDLTDKGSKLLVLTARGVSNLSATESQFSDLYMTNKKKDHFLNFIKSNALVGKKSGISSVAGPIQPEECDATRPIAYQQGVMYVAGQNKGEMLKCLLARTKSKNIKNIVFIDDTLQNVEDVYAAFEQSRKYNVHAYHYTKLEAHKDALTEPAGSEKAAAYQNKANERWLKIKAALKANLIKPSAIRKEDK